ncbi:MAG: hypothetical protein IT431_01030 [Phycisphaerales bacterium]|nr:hypothetical protein [Phycisphaerales bacterium]
MDGSPGIDISSVPAGSDGRSMVVTTFPDGSAFIDTLKLGSAKAREKYASAVVERAPAIPHQAVSAELDKLAAGMAKGMVERAGRSGKPESAQPASADLLKEMPSGVVRDARVALRDPLLIKRIVEDIESLGVAGERELTATIYLVGTSRLLRKPLAAISQGPTSSGKSYQQEMVSGLFPPEAVIHATQMTPQALFHMPEGALVHKFVVAGERSRVQSPETAEATRALREMLSSGKLSKLMPVKVGGQIETKFIEQDGPIAYIESTTVTKIFEEDANRCLLLQTDERPEQTKRIYAALARAYSGQRRQDAIDAIIERHHAMQRLLQQRDVVIPYAERLSELLSPKRVEGRRAFGHILNAVSACTLLHQFQREENGQGRLIASPLDYQIVHRLLDGPLAGLLGNRVSPAAMRFRERLERRLGSDEFSTTDAAAGEAVTARAVRDWLAALTDGGMAEQTETPRGNKPARWKLLPVDPLDLQVSDLPSVEQVFPGDDFRRSGSAQVPAIAWVQAEVGVGAGTVPTERNGSTEVCRQEAVLPSDAVVSQGLAGDGTTEAAHEGDE